MWRLVNNLQNLYRALVWYFTVFYTRWEVAMRKTHQVGDGKAKRCTYNSLRNSDIVGWCCRGWLIRTSGISQNTQLLWSFDAALAQSSQLDPKGADWLVCCDYKIVAFTCKYTKVQSYFRSRGISAKNIKIDLTPRFCTIFPHSVRSQYFFCWKASTSHCAWPSQSD